ncbi:hypothetical protein JTE90_021718 [Oedothorax gibbosus]|uniref:Uncharacterized protein n=1 Tax=Oedothorax gibbosus TaxID=931172 RepID=A0AAV6UDU2_9ARAC|nr:hypothetical protein JTE90_021718 [Oedothorax gibbosus]
MDSQKGSTSQEKISFVKKNRAPNEKDIFTYLHVLRDETEVTEKIKQLSRLSSLTKQDLNNRNAILRRVLKCLQPYYPNCQVFMYGSSNNGFGTQGCDMDILFLPTPDYCRVGGEEDEEKPPTLSQVKNGEFPIIDLEKMGEKAQLLFISKIFKKHFGHTIFIPARCPILNFMGVKGRQANICCDLTCRNKLVVCNTELLKFFGSLDSRVIPLVITLRWWAKSLRLIKEAALSSYAFTLMIIFFLQNSRPSVLPNVNDLMDLSESSTYVAGWPVSFRQDKGSIPETANQDTEEQLLEKFFEFYWNFEFERYAVCVRTGKPLLLEDLKTGSNVGFQITHISIQDPFNLSHNVGKNLKYAFSLKPALFVAKDILTIVSVRVSKVGLECQTFKKGETGRYERMDFS